MSINAAQLKKLSIKELKDVQKLAEEIIEAKQDEALSALREKYKVLAEEVGLDYEMVVGKPRPKIQRSKPAVKYRDPDNPNNTWTGAGRMATWLLEKKKAGQDIEKFRVNH